MLSAKNTSLEEEVGRLTKRLEQTQQAAAQMVREADMRARDTATKLHKIIIESGLSDSGPTDDEVEKAFSHLYHTIFHFVMKYCQYHGSRKGVYGGLPPEAKNLWVVGFIATRIYVDLFAPDVKIFGFGPEDDSHLAKFEDGLLRDDRGKDFMFCLRMELMVHCSSVPRCSGMESADVPFE